jgi:hypothetical protein
MLAASTSCPTTRAGPSSPARSGLNLLNHYKLALLKLAASDDPLIAAIYADARPA